MCPIQAPPNTLSALASKENQVKSLLSKPAPSTVPRCKTQKLFSFWVIRSRWHVDFLAQDNHSESSSALATLASGFSLSMHTNKSLDLSLPSKLAGDAFPLV